MVILGAGAIGAEFAYFYRALGTEVTLVEGMDQILPLEEPDVAEVVATSFKKSGIQLRTNTFCRSARVAASGEEVVVTLESDGEESEVRAERVLVALGITPNTQGLGLEELGVKLDRRGFIKVDGDYRTHAAGNIFAIGDCIPTPALAHTAMAEAHVAVERIAGHHAEDIDYDGMPACTYCQPEVASLGRGEAELTEQEVPFKVGRFPLRANGRALGAGHPEGFVKALVSEEDGTLLGLHMVGYGVTDLLAEGSLARSGEINAETLAGTIHPHPTLSEALLEAVADAIGVSVHI